MINRTIKQPKPQKDNLYTRQESFIVVLDSRNASDLYNGSMNSSLQFQFDDSIQKPPQSFLMTFSVLTFTCPISFYQLNSTNNFLNITIYNYTGVIYATKSYTFPVGNYNVSTFITMFSSVCGGDGFSLTFNSNNNKFSIINNTRPFQILNSGNSTIGEVMGFVKGISYLSDGYPYTFQQSSYSLTLPFTCNFGGINAFNIICRNLETKNINSNTGCVSPIIASIPVNNAQNNTVYFEKKTNMDFIFNYETLDYLQIDIQDDLGNFIDFNNQNWNLVLQFNDFQDIEKGSTRDNFYEITGFVLDTPNMT